MDKGRPAAVQGRDQFDQCENVWEEDLILVRVVGSIVPLFVLGCHYCMD